MNMAQKRALAVPTLVRQSDVAAEIERRKQAARAREEESMREVSRREAPKVRVAVGPEGGNGVRLVEQVSASERITGSVPSLNFLQRLSQCSRLSEGT